MLAGYHENHPIYTFKAMDDLYGRGTPDADWLQHLPDDPPHIVITKDDGLLKDSGQLRAWIRGGLTVVIFGPDFANLKREEMAIALFRWLPTIIRTIADHPRGMAFGVPAAFRQLDRLPEYTATAPRSRPRRPKPKNVDLPTPGSKPATVRIQAPERGQLALDLVNPMSHSAAMQRQPPSASEDSPAGAESTAKSTEA
jgi:hypothetical protein